MLLRMKKSEFDVSKLLLIIAFYNNGHLEQIKNMVSPCEVPTISVLKVKTDVSSSLAHYLFHVYLFLQLTKTKPF